MGKHIWNIADQELKTLITTIDQQCFYTGLGVVKISDPLFNSLLTGPRSDS